jgi:glycerophosphoryl diester phosphodiesterase
MHDDTVDRTTDGTGHVAELTLARIRRLDAGSWNGTAFAGERVPTLDEFGRRAAAGDPALRRDRGNRGLRHARA